MKAIRLSFLGILISLYVFLSFIFTLHALMSSYPEVRKLAVDWPLWQKANSTQMSAMCHRPIGIDYFPNLIEAFNVPRRNSFHIPRKMSEDQYDTLMRLLYLSMKVFYDNDIEYTVSAGGLIGSYVMHDMLPWDDDMDILINEKHMRKVVELFKDDRHYGIQGYQNKNQPGSVVKLFFTSSPSTSKYNWRWPFLDIESYIEEGDQIKLADRSDRNVSWSRDSYFPFHRRPFGPLWLNFPRDPKGYLRAHYLHHFKCKTQHWDHEKEKLQPRLEVDCDLLAPHYPFVKRTPFANITKETLVLNETELYTIYIDEPYKETEYELGWW